MKNRRLIISLALFFSMTLLVVYSVTLPETISNKGIWDNLGKFHLDNNGSPRDPDLEYYSKSGTFGTGHDLTLAISLPLAKVSIYLLPLFFFSVFVFGVYYFIKPFVKYPEWAFILAPLTILTTVLAQIFAVGLFWFVLGFYFRDKKHPQRRYKILMSIFMFLVVLAHFWSGICLVGIFMAFLVIERKWKLIHITTPAILLLALIALIMRFTPAGMFTAEFMQYAPGEIPTFFTLYTRDMGYLISALAGIIFLFKHKEFSLLKIVIPLLLTPILLMLFLPYDWVWRLFYFMPLLPLTSLFMSYAWEHKEKRKNRG